MGSRLAEIVMSMTMREFIREMQRVAQREPEMCERALRKAAEEIRDSARAMIGTEDAEWAPLAESTVSEKERLGYTGKVSATDPLLRTGELRDSIEVRDVSPSRAIVASDDPVLAYQEFGTSRIPPRPVIGAALFRSKAAIEKILGTAAASLIRGVRDA